MIYSSWAFKSCRLVCDKREMERFKMKAMKDLNKTQLERGGHEDFKKSLCNF